MKKRFVMKNTSRRAGSIIFAILILMLTLTACGKSEFGVTENTGKQMTVTAQNADKNALVMVGSLDVADGEETVITAKLSKGSVRVEIVATSEEQSIDKLPDLDGEAMLTADLVNGDSVSGTVPAGSYLLRATCLEKATGTVQIEVRPAVMPAAEVPASTHRVEVTDQSVTTYIDNNGDEYQTIIPRLIVDGKEADSINAALRDHINRNHPLTKNEYGVDGEETRYAWGVRGDIVSIIIIASETFTDGVGYDVFNYNADTLQPAGNDEVLRSFGMTADEFCNKVAEAYRALWDSRTYLQENMSDLDRSIDAISAADVTPFVMPDGNPGAAGRIYVTGSQFAVSVKCFHLDTLNVEYFTEE
ncbi:MAG: hypothetical protein K6C08_08625 [Oscillospiraceae bacterium]|nr:hypothetical protein [Oscillospiraceae bacterium]